MKRGHFEAEDEIAGISHGNVVLMGSTYRARITSSCITLSNLCTFPWEGYRKHTRWKEQDNALHAWTPLCSKYRAPKSANNDGIGGKKETVTTTSRCPFTIDLSPPVTKAHRGFLYSIVFTIEEEKGGGESGGNTKFHHDDPQIVRLDDSRDSLRELPAAKNRYHS